MAGKEGRREHEGKTLSETKKKIEKITEKETEKKAERMTERQKGKSGDSKQVERKEGREKTEDRK